MVRCTASDAVVWHRHCGFLENVRTAVVQNKKYHAFSFFSFFPPHLLFIHSNLFRDFGLMAFLRVGDNTILAAHGSGPGGVAGPDGGVASEAGVYREGSTGLPHTVL